MDVLKAALLGLVTAAACYQPELESCVVSCADGAGCPDGMVCGSESRCVFSLEETCTGAMVEVDIFVRGKGRVADPTRDIDCDRACSYTLPAGTRLELVPEADGKRRFDRWLEEPCDQFSFTCSVTLDETGLVATAEFEEEEDDD